MMKAVRAEGFLTTLRDALGMAGRAARRPHIVRLLARTAHITRTVQKLYRDYPKSPETLGPWIERVRLQNSVAHRSGPGS
jgi:hypothetical protein